MFALLKPEMLILGRPMMMVDLVAYCNSAETNCRGISCKLIMGKIVWKSVGCFRQLGLKQQATIAFLVIDRPVEQACRVCC